MTFKNVASDLAAFLAGQTAGGRTLASGKNLFGALVWPPKPLSVHLIVNGGPPPEPYLSTAASAVVQAQVQAVMYAAKGHDGYVAGEALARGVLGLLQQATISGYVRVLALESAPLYLGSGSDPRGSDPADLQCWVVNVVATYVA